MPGSPTVQTPRNVLIFQLQSALDQLRQASDHEQSDCLLKVVQSIVGDGDRRDKPILNYTTTGANPNDPVIANK